MKEPDFTYDLEEINADPVWKLAFELSEKDNDNAPIGWCKYLPEAKRILRVKTKEPAP